MTIFKFNESTHFSPPALQHISSFEINIQITFSYRDFCFFKETNQSIDRMNSFPADTIYSH